MESIRSYFADVPGPAPTPSPHPTTPASLPLTDDQKKRSASEFVGVVLGPRCKTMSSGFRSSLVSKLRDTPAPRCVAHNHLTLFAPRQDGRLGKIHRGLFAAHRAAKDYDAGQRKSGYAAVNFVEMVSPPDSLLVDHSLLYIVFFQLTYFLSLNARSRATSRQSNGSAFQKASSRYRSGQYPSRASPGPAIPSDTRSISVTAAKTSSWDSSPSTRHPPPCPPPSRTC